MAKKRHQLQWDGCSDDDELHISFLKQQEKVTETDMWFAEGRKSHMLSFPSGDALRSWKANSFFQFSLQLLISYKTESQHIKNSCHETIYLKSCERDFDIYYELPQPALVATAIKLLQHADSLAFFNLMAEADAYCGYCLGVMKSDIQERQIKTGNAQKKRGEALTEENKANKWKPTKDELIGLLIVAARRSSNPTDAIKSIKKTPSSGQNKTVKKWAYNTVKKQIDFHEINENDWWEKS